MKNFKFYSMAVAAMLLTACATDSTDQGGDVIGNEPQYLAVNLMNVGDTPTRAVGGEYEDGTKEESHINKVRFYFFHADGSPYTLTNSDNGNANWLETSEDINTTDKNPDKTVEMISKKVLVLKGTTSTAPATVVAIVNPETLTQNTLGSEAIDINTMRQTLIDTKFTNGQGKDAKDFVMTNSVYMDAGTSICASIVSGHVGTTQEEAEKKPVDIYVERVVAKVAATVNENKFRKGDSIDWDRSKYGIQVGTYGNNTNVYAVIDGWGVADEDGKAELEKQIDGNWTNANLGITPWSTADYHRSFWSKSVPFNSGMGEAANQPVNHSFNAYTSQVGDYLYTLPNTPSDVSDFSNPYDNYLTKFLVAAHLVYEDAKTKQWHNAEICEYKGVQYLGVEALKKEIAMENNNYYVKDSTGAYVTLRPEDITFSDASTDIKDYEVIPTLAKTDITYYTKGGSTESTGWTEVNASAINTKLAEDKAQVRTEGKTYYYAPIRHLATDSTKVGYYGVVRNHLYNINLNTIAGFGTPVYDPNRVIDPTIPSNSNTYLSAQIKVLQWRVVNNNVDLDKTK